MPITLSSRFARRTALVGAAATLSIVLGACANNFGAQTLQPYQAAEGTNADSDTIHVRNMLVLADAQGKGEIHGVIVNSGTDDDTLVKIEQAPQGTQDGAAGGDQPTSVTFSELKSPVDLTANTATLLPGTGQESGSTTSPSESPTASPSETPGSEASGPAITVEGAKPGQMVNVVITFGKAAPITTYIPVLTDDHYSPSPNTNQ